MSIRRQFANFFIVGCGLRRLHNGRIQRLARAVFDEIDLQRLRDEYPCRQCDGRAEMYQFIHSSVIQQGPIDFLEFGVFQGDSMREWTSMNRDPQSRFYGFDSFEGLPETWRTKQEKGHFNVGGTIPEIVDARVKFIKGWFDKTVPDFARNFTPRARLVLHLDADLYSSTLIPLIYFSPFLQKGSLLVFDEFYDRNHEFKAFHDFLKVRRSSYRVVCQLGNYDKVCIELL